MVHKKPPGTPLPRLYLISSGQERAVQSTLLLEQLRQLATATPCLVQIREKQLGAAELFALARMAAEVDLPEGSRLLVNERADIALAAPLQGVHLPESGCSPLSLRHVAPELIIGCSVHSPASALSAEEAGADYLLFGPIFDTPSKRKFGAPQGLLKLRELCRMSSLPVYALGGVTPENAASCMEAGAYGTAGLSIFGELDLFLETVDKFYRVLHP